MPMKMITRNRKMGSRLVAGFTLLEVLVAVFVLSLGMLGVASLQVIAKRSNFEAIQRSQATVLANAAIDRMRSNSEVLNCYAATDLVADGADPSACGAAGDAALIAVANQDLVELDQLLEDSDSLVEPVLCITNRYPPGVGANGDVRVVVAWRGVSERVGPIVDGNCGTAIDAANRKQVVIDTYITPFNPD